jgi:Flp pilus assembly protein TadG
MSACRCGNKLGSVGGVDSRPAGVLAGAAREEQGSSLVEFALVFLFVLAPLLFGIMEFGRGLYAYHFVSHAAKSAARWAAVNGSTCNGDGSCNGTYGMSNGPATAAAVSNFVTSIAPPGINTTQLTTTPSWPVQADSPTICSTTQNYPGCTVEVQVSYQFSFLSPLVRSSSVTLSSTSEMIISH